jgi:hypothetical protein
MLRNTHDMFVSRKRDVEAESFWTFWVIIIVRFWIEKSWGGGSRRTLGFRVRSSSKALLPHALLVLIEEIGKVSVELHHMFLDFCLVLDEKVGRIVHLRLDGLGPKVLNVQESTLVENDVGLGVSVEREEDGIVRNMHLVPSASVLDDALVAVDLDLESICASLDLRLTFECPPRRFVVALVQPFDLVDDDSSDTVRLEADLKAELDLREEQVCKVCTVHAPLERGRSQQVRRAPFGAVALLSIGESSSASTEP